MYRSKDELSRIILSPKLSFREAIQVIESAHFGIGIVIDQKMIVGIITDQDIRKAVLHFKDMDGPVSDVINENPVVIKEDECSRDYIKDIFLKHGYTQLPIVDSEGHFVDLVIESDLFRSELDKKPRAQLNLPVVIMAGGKGSRLDPFTRVLPKPLIPIGDKPMIEVIMDEFASFGMHDFYVSVNHKGKMIKAYFEDHNSDYSFTFIDETIPLGTAGALKYLEGTFTSPLFVTNCDIILKFDYSKLFEYHMKNENDLTLVASMYTNKIPYGICRVENDGSLISIVEKPQRDVLVNSGMYILNPDILKYIPRNKYFHITDLIDELKKEDRKVGVFPVSSNAWTDIGQLELYKKYVKDISD